MNAVCAAKNGFLVLCIMLSGQVAAANLLGLYVGGAFGRAQVEADNLPNPEPAPLTAHSIERFSENHLAYEAIVGVRPISLVGTEITYVDFGHASEALGTIPVGPAVSAGFPLSGSVRMKGPAAFAVLYLPVPVIDFYFKAGLARLQTTAITTLTVPAPYATCVTGGGARCQFSRESDVNNTGIAAAAGAQFKVASLAVRAEYARFSAAGANPGLFSLGLVWNF